MKKRTTIILSCLTLVACGGGSSAISCDQEYWDGTIGTCLPEGWEVIDSETLYQRGVPEETIVAFQSSESLSGQFPTVAVTREKLASVVEPKTYSDANIRSIQVIDGYEHVDTRDFAIAGEDVSLHIFTAQPIEGEPRRRFYQVSTTYGDTGYTVTGVSPVSIGKELEDKLLLMIGQVVFEEPQTEE